MTERLEILTDAVLIPLIDGPKQRAVFREKLTHSPAWETLREFARQNMSDRRLKEQIEKAAMELEDTTLV